jgi:hypothetical protein
MPLAATSQFGGGAIESARSSKRPFPCLGADRDSPPPDDRAGPLHPVMLPQIGSPSASASIELFPRLRPPGAKAAAALGPFRPAPNFIVDEDLSPRRRLFRCQPIAVHQRREAVRSEGVPRLGLQGVVCAERNLSRGRRPGPRGGNSKPGPRAVPGQSKARQQRWRQLSGFTGAVASSATKPLAVA